MVTEVQMKKIDADTHFNLTVDYRNLRDPLDRNPSATLTDVPLANVDSSTLWADIKTSGPRPHAYLGSASLDSDDAMRAEHARRRSFIAFYGYSVQTHDAIAAIAEFVGGRATLEICAGLGLWARLLSDAGVDIIATDGVLPQGLPHHAIHELEAEAAVRTHRTREVLLICWPPDKQNLARRALHAFTGARLIFIGDERFTADAEFHASLASDWVLDRRLALPSWPGLNDAVRLYTRRVRQP